ncbi:MAG: DUF2500 domain-containing protein [Oscillospiraceae bacterium]|nr:DUF2500 domain-containing protein [Oscillospiraceae bacterium]
MGPFGTGFGALSALIGAAAIAIFAIALVRGIGQWSENNRAPRLSVQAWVRSRREDVTYTRHPVAGDATGAHGYHTTANIRRFVTFQTDSGEQIELSVSGQEYDRLIEGDRGTLTFQGTRYIDFQRS